MVRDRQGRIVLSGSGRPPNALVVRLRGNGARDTRFGNGGLTFPRLGRPPGGEPIYTTLDGRSTHGLARGHRRLSRGSRPLRAPGNGTLYTGRFALTVSKLQ